MKKILWLFAGILFLAGMPCLSWAQENQNNDDSGETVVVADVNFRDMEIVSQDGNRLKIKFTLTNGEMSQANVMYSIIIVDRTSDGNVLVDEYIYDESINLVSNQKIEKEIDYIAPEYLSGKYGIMLQSKNKSGLILAFGDLGDITLAGSDSYVGLENCRLYSEGKNEEFSPFQGVDVSAEENLIARCILNNKMQKDVSVTPIFETRLRSDFGEIVKTTPAKTISFDLIMSNAKEVEIALPKASNPQSYNVKVNFIDESGKVVSNNASFHYVLRGESSTIQNVSLDKASYLKGEQAKIMFFWSGSADDFPESRAENRKTATNYSLTITDANGENCIEPVKRALEEDNPFVNLTENIIKDCAKPNVSASVTNDQGKALDKLEYDFSNEKKKDTIGYTEKENKVVDLKWILAMLFAAIVVLATTFVLFKKNKGFKLWGLLFLMGSMFLITNDFASAVTACNRQMCANAGINKGTYAPSENIATTASVAGNHSCGNYWYDGNYYGGVSSASTNMGSFHIKGHVSYVANFSLNSTAPGVGSYNMVYQVYATQTCTTSNPGGKDDCNAKSNNIGPMYVGFNVAIPVVHGACGTRSTTYPATTTTWPAANTWCSAGTPSGTPAVFPNSGETTANWSCIGSGPGHTNATTCNTSRKFSAPSVNLKINGSDGPISPNLDNGDNLDISWTVVSNASGATTYCSKTGNSWGSGQIIPPKGLVDSDNDIPLPSGAYPINNSPYSLSCYNGNGNSNLDSASNSDSVLVSVYCTATPDSWTPCNKECGAGTTFCSNKNNRCIVSSCGSASCNPEPCPVTSEWKEVRP